MSEMTSLDVISGRELIQTLWRCHRCSALIAIYSAEVIELVICPICCDVTLDQRGSFETILGMAFEDRSRAVS
jgi:Zn-finger nucleic acid-binding protein